MKYCSAIRNFASYTNKQKIQIRAVYQGNAFHNLCGEHSQSKINEICGQQIFD